MTYKVEYDGMVSGTGTGYSVQGNGVYYNTGDSAEEAYIIKGLLESAYNLGTLHYLQKPSRY